MAKIIGLNSYPVKGLSSTNHTQVAIDAGKAFPSDRIFGLVRFGNSFDPFNPKPLSKEKFWVLAQEQRLAILSTHLNQETFDLTVVYENEAHQVFCLKTDQGKRDFENFIAAFLNLPVDEKPTLYHAKRHRFTDVSVVSDEMMNAISLINLGTIRKFEEDTEMMIDPKRFRANIFVDDMPAFSELDMVGKTLKIGEILFEIVMKTKRCAATEVNPNSAERDIKVPYLLRKHYGHFDMGVYMIAKNKGRLFLGDKVEITDF